MSMQNSRRDFLRTAAVTGFGVWIGTEARAQEKPKSPNEQVSFACIGVGGKGDSDSNDAAHFGNIVAICDVDQNTLNKKGERYPNAKKYTDYRKMYDEMGKQIDAVTVSVPDHNHGPATALALHMGKACYTQKPLAHSIYECRQLAALAHKMKAVTQMGNQGTADNSMRRNAYRVRAGAIGQVKEVHVWTNRPIWPQGIDRSPEKPVPPYLDWQVWLGPAKERPYGDNYHTFAWRGWWDFGTGALGDMACHTVNLPFMALDLRNPVSVVATCSGHNKDSYPKSSKIIYEFPATVVDGKPRPPVTMYWYDGGNRLPKDLAPAELLPDNGEVPISGSLIIGDKGKLYTPGDYGGGGHIVGGDQMKDIQYPESKGHWEDFMEAIHGGTKNVANFPDYAGPLAETILLGNLAVWPAWKGEGEKILWDAKNLRVKNGREVAEQVAEIIKPTYRSGYHL
ncbi:MAG TPA: Gfo/Idh/MocA family oxidoreductase [Chthonomonadaceae bacterium]|nr:Gfo/Idh/MocA family oxidoreductase [Chthonomonadaceae bacterium]